MSNWTHVAGIIRIDHVRVLDGEIMDFDNLIGKECLWESDMETWKEQEEFPERFLPMGSEGSLQKTVWVNPDWREIPAYTVSIFGDLRDHHDPDAILDWFKNVCDKLCIRNAVINAWNEWNGDRVWHYPKEDKSV